MRPSSDRQICIRTVFKATMGHSEERGGSQTCFPEHVSTTLNRTEWDYCQPSSRCDSVQDGDRHSMNSSRETSPGNPGENREPDGWLHWHRTVHVLRRLAKQLTGNTCAQESRTVDAVQISRLTSTVAPGRNRFVCIRLSTRL